MRLIMSIVFSTVFKNTKYLITFDGGRGTNLGVIKETSRERVRDEIQTSVKAF